VFGALGLSTSQLISLALLLVLGAWLLLLLLLRRRSLPLTAAMR
jgi:hypothetical protein